MGGLVLTKVLITGGAGFIGYHLSKNLSEHGYDVTLCDNFFRGKKDIELNRLVKNKNVKLINCDLTKKEQLKKLGNGYQYVYHLAAINGTRYFYEMPETVLRVNILSAINILDWFISSDCKKILFASSSEVYASNKNLIIPTPENVPLSISDVYNPRFSYAGSKIAGELLFVNYSRKYNFRMSIVRYHNIYGTRMGFEHVVPEFITRVLKKEDPFKILGGKETRAFCYVDDAIAATKLVMESEKTDGSITHVGNDTEEVRIIDLAKMMLKRFNFKPRLDIRPSPKGSVKRRCPNISKLRNIGYKPKIDLRTGLEKTFEWYRKVYTNSK